MNAECLLSEWVVSAVEGTGQVFSALALFVVLFVAQLVVLVPLVLQALRAQVLRALPALHWVPLVQRLVRGCCWGQKKNRAIGAA
jgi:hypothetical protein